jgi:hypothetical protein
MLPTKFRFIWSIGFRREELKTISQSETIIACDGHVFSGFGRNEKSLQRTFHRGFLPSFGLFGQAVSEEIN